MNGASTLQLDPATAIRGAIVITPPLVDGSADSPAESASGAIMRDCTPQIDVHCTEDHSFRSCRYCTCDCERSGEMEDGSRCASLDGAVRRASPNSLLTSSPPRRRGQTRGSPGAPVVSSVGRGAGVSRSAYMRSPGECARTPAKCHAGGNADERLRKQTDEFQASITPELVMCTTSIV